LDLIRQNGEVIPDPTELDIRRYVRSDLHSTLERGERFFIQAARRRGRLTPDERARLGPVRGALLGDPQFRRKREFDLEYQDGALSRHFYAVDRPITDEHVIEAYCKYLRGDGSWRSDFQWEKLDLLEYAKRRALLAMPQVFRKPRRRPARRRRRPPVWRCSGGAASRAFGVGRHQRAGALGPARSAAEARPTELHFQSGAVIAEPTEIDIKKYVINERFSILSRDPDTYIQCARTDGLSRLERTPYAIVTGEEWLAERERARKREYLLEYQEGGIDRHFVAIDRPVTIDRVIKAFCKYLRGDESWWTEFRWRKLDLSKVPKKRVLPPMPRELRLPRLRPTRKRRRPKPR
jgi:hypothetical protein